jgi:arsenate reductase-like glutaredoxin family protein
MAESFIKKIINTEELKKISEDLKEIYNQDNDSYGHALDLKHDIDLIAESISHESLLIWNIHVWAHFNGEKWDSIFIGITRKSEKFGKKIMDEYLWLSKDSSAGLRLYKEAVNFAKSQKCEYIFMNAVERHPLSEKIKKFYKAIGFQKDSEVFVKKL